MYPEGDLKRLAGRKALVRSRIALHRMETALYGRDVMRPVLAIDRAITSWRRISPWVKLAAVPLGFMAQRSVLRRIGPLRRILRWAPTALGALRIFREMSAGSSTGPQ